MMTSLRWGILGPGSIANLFAQDLRSVGLDLVAVGSRSRTRAEQFATAYDIPHAHGSYQSLVEDPEVDAIYIATPHPEHAGNAILALEHGKHVLIEKPFALTGAQARAVQATAQRTGRFAMEAMRTRFMPHTVRIHELIDSGALGELRMFLADHNQALDRDPAGRLWNPRLGGGALLDLGIYPVSFASDFMGRPAEITAQATMTDTHVDLATSMIFRYSTGAQAVVETAMDARGPNTATILGTEARVEVASVFYKSSRFRLIDGKDHVLEDFDEPYPFWGKQFEALEVERCIEQGLLTSPRMSLDESVSIMDTMDEIRRQIGLHYPQEDER